MHELWQYINLQLNVVPKPVYEGLLALFCVGAIVLLAVNRKKAGRHIAWLLFFECEVLVLGMTVFSDTRAPKQWFTPRFGVMRVVAGMET